MPIAVMHLMPEISFMPKLGLHPALLVTYSVVLARWLMKLRFGNDLAANTLQVIRHQAHPTSIGRGGDRGIATEPV